jgi:hypothetical protein
MSDVSETDSEGFTLVTRKKKKTSSRSPGGATPTPLSQVADPNFAAPKAVLRESPPDHGETLMIPLSLASSHQDASNFSRLVPDESNQKVNADETVEQVPGNALLTSSSSLTPVSPVGSIALDGTTLPEAEPKQSASWRMLSQSGDVD